jgi:hypothetical protein
MNYTERIRTLTLLLEIRCVGRAIAGVRGSGGALELLVSTAANDADCRFSI